MTPCAYAAAEGHRGLMDLLLDAGAAVDKKAADGSTPLLLAAGKQAARIVVGSFCGQCCCQHGGRASVQPAGL